MNTASNIVDDQLGFKETPVPTQPQQEGNNEMFALTWQGKGTIKYTKVPKPDIDDPQDALIRITATTACGSDLMLLYDVPTMREGDITGHEAMGIVEKVGDGVKNIKVGDRVVIAFNMSCGTCDFCQRGEFTACDNTNSSKLEEELYGHRTAGLLGYSSLMGRYPGVHAEYARIPYADVNLLKVPDSVPDDRALYLSDIVPTSYHAVKDIANLQEGETVVIFGLGPIGLCCARWCQILGAKVIIGVDDVEDRLELARNKLGIITVDLGKENVQEAILHMLPQGADVGIDATGFRFAQGLGHKIQRALNLETDTPEAISDLSTVTRKYGRLSIIADYVAFANQFPVGKIVMKHQMMQGGQSPTQKNWKTCLEYIESGEFDPTFCVTHKFNLSDGAKVWDMMYNREDGIIKPFIRPNGMDEIATLTP